MRFASKLCGSTTCRFSLPLLQELTHFETKSIFDKPYTCGIILSRNSRLFCEGHSAACFYCLRDRKDCARFLRKRGARNSWAMWTPVDAYAGFVASKSSSTRESALWGASQALNLMSAQAVYRSQIPQEAWIAQVGLDSLAPNFLDRGGGCT